MKKRRDANRQTSRLFGLIIWGLVLLMLLLAAGTPLPDSDAADAPPTATPAPQGAAQSECDWQRVTEPLPGQTSALNALLTTISLPEGYTLAYTVQRTVENCLIDGVIAATRPTAVEAAIRVTQPADATREDAGDVVWQGLSQVASLLGENQAGRDPDWVVTIDLVIRAAGDETQQSVRLPLEQVETWLAQGITGPALLDLIDSFVQEPSGE